MRSCVVVSTEKKSSFLGSPRDVFRRPSAAREPIAPKFLHTTFPSKYVVLAEFHPPRLSFGGVMLPTPSFASLQWPAIYYMAGHNYFYCGIAPEGLFYDAERDLLAIAKFILCLPRAALS